MRTRSHLPVAATLAAVLAAGAAMAPYRAVAAGERPLDHDVKAALLFNFLKFVEWGAERRTIQVCAVGETRVLDAFAALQGRSTGGRAVVVRPARHDDVAGCDVVFIAASESARLDGLLARLGHTRTLAVGDGSEFAARGAHLNFYVDGDHVRFEANVIAIRRDGIQVSSKLLRLARLVGTR